MNQAANRLIPCFALACALAWPVAGHAEGTVKLGRVNMEHLLVNSEPGKKLLAPLNELINSTRVEAKRLEGEINRIREQAVDLNKTPSPANEQALATLQQQYSKDMADLDRLDKEARQSIEKQRYQSLSEFNHIAMPVIQSLGKEQGYTMIFREQESGLLYADDASDLTDQVIQRLNTQAGAK